VNKRAFNGGARILDRHQKDSLRSDSRTIGRAETALFLFDHLFEMILILEFRSNHIHRFAKEFAATSDLTMPLNG
jgi:hypothetical protein